MKNIFPKTPNQSQISQQQQLIEMLKNNPQLMKKYQEELTKYQSTQKFKNVAQPMSSKQYIEKVNNKQMQSCLDSEGGLIIIPEEGFVVKYLDKRSNEKIFVNIVKHQAVDHPQQKQLIDFDNQVGLRIPMSMGKIREDRDKNGNACKVVDVVMNPKIISTAEKDADIFNFMGQIIANYLLEKHKIAVSDQMMKKVKGLKYKGNTVEIQRVKAKKAPKIQQLSQQQIKNENIRISEQQKLFNQISGQNDNNKKLSRPQFKVYVISFDGKKDQYFFDTFKKVDTKSIIFEIDLSLLIHSRGIHLEASTNLLYLSVKGFYQLCLRMPLQIESYKAKFGLKQRKLSIEGIPVNERFNRSIETKDKIVNFNQLTKKQESKNVVKDIKIDFQNQLLDQLV